MNHDPHLLPRLHLAPAARQYRAWWLTAALLSGVAAAQTTILSTTLAPVTAPTSTAQVLTLQDALSALPQAPQWRQADLAYQAAQLALVSAQAAVGLTVAVGTTATGTLGAASALTTSVNATASLNVLPWSSTNDAVRATQRALTTAQATRDTTRQKLQQTVAQQYFAARLAQQDLTLAQQTNDLRQVLLQAATQQRAQNTITQETLLTRQTEAQQAAAALASAQTALQNGTFALASTLGTSLNQVSFTTDGQVPSAPGDVNALVQQALTRRSEVIGAQAALADAQDALTAAQRDRRLPALTADVSAGTGSTAVTGSLDLKTGDLTAKLTQPLTGTTSETSASFAVGVSASYTLIDPSGDAKIASAQTSVASAQTNLGLERQTVEQDVRQRAATLQNALNALTAAQTTVTAAQSTLSTTEAQFATGTAVTTDVTNAQVNLLQAQRDLENARETAQLDQVALQLATGGSL